MVMRHLWCDAVAGVRMLELICVERDL